MRSGRTLTFGLVLAASVAACRGPGGPTATTTVATSATTAGPAATTAAPTLPPGAACPSGTRVDLLKLLLDPKTTTLTAMIDEDRPIDRASMRGSSLISHVTSVLHGSAQTVGARFTTLGDGDCMKALCPLDSRVIRPGKTELVIACGEGTSAVVLANEENLAATKACVAIVNPTGPIEERAARLGDAVIAASGEAEFLRPCARAVFCANVDPLVSAMAIDRAASTYDGDPLTVWELLSGLHLDGELGYRERDGCNPPPRLVDAARGADPINTAAISALVGRAVKKPNEANTNFAHAESLLDAVGQPGAAKMVAKLDPQRKKAALALLATAAKGSFSTLRQELAKPLATATTRRSNPSRPSMPSS